jgi:hypothetical protein
MQRFGGWYSRIRQEYLAAKFVIDVWKIPARIMGVEKIQIAVVDPHDTDA